MMTQTWVGPCSAAKLKQSWTSTTASLQANSKLRESIMRPGCLRLRDKRNETFPKLLIKLYMIRIKRSTLSLRV
uniref:Uncharacterized protein n=1 Tax=Arundo donax TaxID=35708 RepID=A0A0A9EZ94_ARUDO